MASSTVGTARDYPSLANWELDTDNDLVTATAGETAVWHDDQDWTWATALAIAGADTSADYYREIVPATGDEFDPVADTGLNWTASFAGNMIATAEGYLRMSGPYALRPTFTGSNSSAILANSGTCDYGVYERLYVLVDENNASYNRLNIGISLSGGATSTDNTVRNCIIEANTATGGDTLDSAIYINSINAFVYNNSCYGGDDHGISCNQSSATIKNNICMDFSAADIDDLAGTYSNNCVADNSIPTGSGNLRSQTDTDIFEDPANSDFHLKSGSNAIDAGTSLSGSFTDDYDEDTRSGTWEMGAYIESAAGGGVTVSAGVQSVPITKGSTNLVLDSVIGVGAKTILLTPKTESHTHGSKHFAEVGSIYLWEMGQSTIKWNPVGGSNTCTIETPADVTFRNMRFIGDDAATLKTTQTWGTATTTSAGSGNFWTGHVTFDGIWMDGGYKATGDREDQAGQPWAEPYDGVDGTPFLRTRWGIHTYDTPKLTVKNSRLEGIYQEHAYYDHVHCSTLPSLIHRVLQNNYIRWCGRTAFQHVARSGSVRYPGAEGLNPNPPGGEGGGLVEIRDNYVEDVCNASGGGGSAFTFAGGMPSIDAIIDNNTVRLGCNPLMSGADRQDYVTGVVVCRFERESSTASLGKEGRTWNWETGHALKTLTITNNDFEVGSAGWGSGGSPRRMLDLSECETLIIGAGNRFVKAASFPDPVVGQIECNSSEYHAGTNTTYTGEIGTVYLTHPANMTSHGRWIFTRPNGTSNTYGGAYGTGDGYALMFTAECSPTGGEGGNCYPLDDWPP